MVDGSATSQARFPVDLHCHTTRSDGSLSPTDVVTLAARRGVKHLAITDHDTTDGVAEATEAAADHDLEIIPGIEISAWLEREVHILGYFIDAQNDALRAVTARQREARIARVHTICERLTELGKPLDPLEILADAHGANVGRPHIARALVKAGHARGFDDAFRRYLGADAAAYVPATRFAADAAIDLIHGAGGVAVIAHPGVEGLESQLPYLAAHGLDGVESEHPAHGRRTVRRFRSLAKRYGLARTGGSDFHAPNGKACVGEMGVELTHLETLRRRTARYRDGAPA